MPRKYRLTVVSLSYDEWRQAIANGQIHGQLGQLEHSPDGKLITCHLCGLQYTQITPSHIRRHGLKDLDQFRKLLGLNRSQPLTAPNLSDFKAQWARVTKTAQRLKQHWFTSEDPRRKDSRLSNRPQARISRVMGSDNSSTITRSVTQGGCFWVFNRKYTFSRTARGTEISVVIHDRMISATGKINGQVTTRTYRRKDDLST